jgi:ankyrin repeat protein
MFTRPLKSLACFTLAVCFSAAHAGAFEDFFIAVKNDNVGAVGDFLKRGFDPNSRDPKGQTGLNVAMMEQSPKSAKLLLAQPGIDINAVNNAGESALMLAALKGDMADVKLLLDRGAKVNLAGWSPLHYAATGPDPKIVQLLIDNGADLNARSPNGTTPLMMAAQYGSEDNVKVLLDHGADLSLRNQKDLGALDFAKASGRAPLVRQLEQRQR